MRDREIVDELDDQGRTVGVAPTRGLGGRAGVERHDHIGRERPDRLGAGKARTGEMKSVSSRWKCQPTFDLTSNQSVHHTPGPIGEGKVGLGRGEHDNGPPRERRPAALRGIEQRTQRRAWIVHMRAEVDNEMSVYSHQPVAHLEPDIRPQQYRAADRGVRRDACRERLERSPLGVNPVAGPGRKLADFGGDTQDPRGLALELARKAVARDAVDDESLGYDEPALCHLPPARRPDRAARYVDSPRSVPI